jgi:2-keto-3-deoxy-6-phosphogluconate aldolase
VFKTLSGRYGDAILLGMGTLTRPEQAEASCQAGATFIVSPICQVELMKGMLNIGLVVMTGRCCTARYSKLINSERIS